MYIWSIIVLSGTSCCVNLCWYRPPGSGGAQTSKLEMGTCVCTPNEYDYDTNLQIPNISHSPQKLAAHHKSVTLGTWRVQVSW